MRQTVNQSAARERPRGSGVPGQGGGRVRADGGHVHPGRRAARQSGTQGEGRAHQDRLDEGQAREQPSRQRIRADPVHHARALPPPRQAEHDQDDHLEDHQGAVARCQGVDRADPDPRVGHPGYRNGDEAPPGEGGVPLDADPQRGAEQRAQHRQRQQATDPHHGRDQMHGQGVDSQVVVTGTCGVTGQGQRQYGQDAERGQGCHGRTAARQRGADGHHQGQRAADRGDPQEVELEHEGLELGPEGGVAQRWCPTGWRRRRPARRARPPPRRRPRRRRSGPR
jgi:hypothetical protein